MMETFSVKKSQNRIASFKTLPRDEDKLAYKRRVSHGNITSELESKEKRG